MTPKGAADDWHIAQEGLARGAVSSKLLDYPWAVQSSAGKATGLDKLQGGDGQRAVFPRGRVWPWSTGTCTLSVVGGIRVLGVLPRG